MTRSGLCLVLGALIGTIGTLGYLGLTGDQYTYMVQGAGPAWFESSAPAPGGVYGSHPTATYQALLAAGCDPFQVSGTGPLYLRCPRFRLQ